MPDKRLDNIWRTKDNSNAGKHTDTLYTKNATRLL